MVPNGDHILTGYMELNTSALCLLTVKRSSAFQWISHVFKKKSSCQVVWTLYQPHCTRLPGFGKGSLTSIIKCICSQGLFVYVSLIKGKSRDRLSGCAAPQKIQLYILREPNWARGNTIPTAGPQYFYTELSVTSTHGWKGSSIIIKNSLHTAI